MRTHTEIERRAPAPSRSPHREHLLRGLPLAERRLRLAGVPTALLEGGEGPPLVLLHGPGGSALKWLRVVPGLLPDHRVIVPDLPGHGESGEPEGALDAARVLDWLGELVERTCPTPPTLVGHVVGGAIAARFAARHGDRLSRLVLVDSLGLARFRPTPRFLLALLGFQVRPTAGSHERLMRQCSADLDAVRARMGERWESFAAYDLAYARSGRARAVGHLLRTVGLPRIPPEELARIRVPTALVWGRHDRANRLQVAEEASARYGWPLHVIEECADEPALDQPEALVAVLRAIFRAN